jgi:hypothetical protein
MSTMYTSEFLVSDLTTKSVTLGPTNTTVVREIQDVQVNVRIINSTNHFCVLCNC